MSLPNLPDITPDISLTREEVINLLLSSIAMEEIGLSHILNAEGEKLQHFMKQKKRSFCKYIAINRSVNDTLKTIVKSQLLLQLKLEEVNSIKSVENHEHCKSCKSYEGRTPCFKQTCYVCHPKKCQPGPYGQYGCIYNNDKPYSPPVKKKCICKPKAHKYNCND
ncbi:hypothetical protein [Bacillus thuringiensis]|uniref:Uncharacterized protein n=1 Tax=Bacillus thuringiensis Bt18247 TaxID=1423143 RepID=A0A9W3SYU0_BACTU|nr:hypothetical protein [Bacillus thuringiensis]AOM14235.1 hypothetical protein BTI247_59030 [Bacillus thuringiensis Bt18247]MBG9523733.1 hypothetical protein [Bacillus thuringiensis]